MPAGRRPAAFCFPRGDVACRTRMQQGVPIDSDRPYLQSHLPEVAAMLIGVPKEVKPHEDRVGLVPGSVRERVHHGHKVVVESGARAEIGFDARAYEGAGAEILMRAADVFAAAEMIVKVKEPQPEEVASLREDQILFTYLHLAADRGLTEGLLRSGAVGIAYETVTDSRGGLPLLAPMSEVAGRMSVQVGAHCLEKEQGGMGVLLGGVPGVAAAKVVILGGGVSGTNAARMAMGLEAHVTVIDRSLPRLYELDMQFGSQLHTLFSTVENIEREVVSADLRSAPCWCRVRRHRNSLAANWSGR